ncbi:MAG: ATP-binding protein [Intestinibacter bartlettii]|uniref:ATP-binding protein n=1 Tax=Intestinibacter bartlettii TaxID=261299 RepID=UPI0039A1063B
MGKMKFKISSRAAILLGRESVSKVDGAIIELIKNTYDADATICILCFDIENDSIYIIDNGKGMTEEILNNYWMTIGTNNKKIEYKSTKNRIKSGEKGIGRFALDRLGSKCELYTKNEESEKLIKWSTNWSDFEESGTTLDEMEAEFEFLDKSYEAIIPHEIYDDLMKYDESIDFSTGTLIKAMNLRDNWNDNNIINIISSLGFLIPPEGKDDYEILTMKSLDSFPQVVENEMGEEYDYRIKATFDGEKFNISLYRNEFDLNKIPKDIFDKEFFKQFPFTYEDFYKKEINYIYSIENLMSSSAKTYINLIKNIGNFKFDYTFMKLTLSHKDKENFYYKEISKQRKSWMNNNGGIKIYRDNFLVRPYGIPDSNAYDWIGLDARKTNSPASITHSSGNWAVRNAQGYGYVQISRVYNENILDKASREGVIENEYFKTFKDVLKNIISIFERDRASIARNFKLYNDEINKKKIIKNKGSEIAKKVLEKKDKKVEKYTEEDVDTLAKAVKYFEEEKDELIDEIKMLRSLATNGLITTTITHDLKGLSSRLIVRGENLNKAIEYSDTMMIRRSLEDLNKDDIFLKAWIEVVTNQIKKDKRKRLKKDLVKVISDTIFIIKPILEQKRICVKFKKNGKEFFKKIFVTDFEAILYNLIVNSIESFEKSNVHQKIINIDLDIKDSFIIHYKDNGKGLEDSFKNPNDIFNYGTTSKYDIEGNKIGTGLGMYIVASTLSEYNAKYNLTKIKDGFGIDLKIPMN